MSSIIVLTPPTLPDDPGGKSVIKPRVKVTIEYDPPEFMDAKQVKRVTKALQKAAEAIVAKYG